jgi:hypothetical protein
VTWDAPRAVYAIHVYLSTPRLIGFEHPVRLAEDKAEAAATYLTGPIELFTLPRSVGLAIRKSAEGYPYHLASPSNTITYR